MHLPEDGKDGVVVKKKSRITLDASAGALAGCIARFVVGPLDVIKIRFQVQLEPIMRTSQAPSKYTGIGQALSTIIKEEGVQVRPAACTRPGKSTIGPVAADRRHAPQGLWRGTVPGLLLTIPYTAVQFVALQQCREFAAQLGFTSNPALSPMVSFASGAMAGAAATVASYPFDLLRTTLAAQGEPKARRRARCGCASRRCTPSRRPPRRPPSLHPGARAGPR
jgi:solute carrier family 25 thiamine pyrophosphate transporter 19